MSKHYYFNLFESLINEAGRSSGLEDFPSPSMAKTFWRDVAKNPLRRAGNAQYHGEVAKDAAGRKIDADTEHDISISPQARRYEAAKAEKPGSSFGVPPGPHDGGEPSKDVVVANRKKELDDFANSWRRRAANAKADYGPEVERQATRLRNKRLGKVAARSSMMGSAKRGLAKLAGKFGIGRYSARGMRRANLGESVKLRALFEAALLNRLQD